MGEAEGLTTPLECHDARIHHRSGRFRRENRSPYHVSPACRMAPPSLNIQHGLGCSVQQLCSGAEWHSKRPTQSGWPSVHRFATLGLAAATDSVPATHPSRRPCCDYAASTAPCAPLPPTFAVGHSVCFPERLVTSLMPSRSTMLQCKLIRAALQCPISPPPKSQLAPMLPWQLECREA